MAAAWPSLAAGGRTAATTPQVNRGKGKPPDGLGRGTVQLEPSCTVASGLFFTFIFFNCFPISSSVLHFLLAPNEFCFEQNLARESSTIP